MSEIQNFRIFEERKFKEQYSYLNTKENQSNLEDLKKKKDSYKNKEISQVELKNLQFANKSLYFIKILQIIRTEKKKVHLLVEDLSSTLEVVYYKKNDNDLPFIESAYFNMRLEHKIRKGNLETIVLEYKPIGYNNQIKRKKGPFVYGALISDVHVGSIYFMKDKFINFLKYLNKAKEVKYLFIAGDLIDGIGVYPEQEKNLYEKNAYAQYDEVRRLFEENISREDLKVYFSPGNHDFLSLFEPQVISQEIKKRLPKDWINIENPAYQTIEGKRVLFYHGRSVDNLIMAKTPYLSYEKMERVYHYIFSQRNLSPTVKGSRLDFRRSTGMISEIPDIFLTGHVHKWCSVIQNGVLFCNSGCWQYETEYQKNLDIHAVKGIVQFINLTDPLEKHYKIDFNKDFKEGKEYKEEYKLQPKNIRYLEDEIEE